MTDLENAERLRTYYNTHKPRKKVVNICTARRNWDGCSYCDVYSGCGLECWKQDDKHNCVKCQERQQEKKGKEYAMKLTDTDKQYLMGIGHPEKDFEQIEKASRMTVYKESCGDAAGRKITIARAIELLGRDNFLSGLGRSAFHWSAVRQTEDGKISVSFDSSRLFRE